MLQCTQDNTVSAVNAANIFNVVEQKGRSQNSSISKPIKIFLKKN